MKVIQFGIDILKYAGMVSVVLIMISITAGVISRLLGNPILGTVELAEVFHVILIMFSFAYTQSLKEHISIGIVAKQFPKKIQFLCKQIAYILLIVVCVLLGYIFLNVAMDTTKSTLLLGIPHRILKYIMMIGFIAWGIVALAQMAASWKSSETEVTKDV